MQRPKFQPFFDAEPRQNRKCGHVPRSQGESWVRLLVGRREVTIGELGSLGEIIGAIATVATLLYLAIQIRSNTLASKRRALDNTIDRIARWSARLTESPDLLRAWIDGHQSFNRLFVAPSELRLSQMPVIRIEPYISSILTLCQTD